MCSHTDKLQLQFGRVGRDEFILDYSYPFNGLQAFAVAVTSLAFRTIGSD